MLLVIFTGIVSFFMVLPLTAAIVFREKEMIRAFAVSMAPAAAALPVFIFSGKKQIEFTVSGGIRFVVFAWVFTSFSGALPYVLSGHVPSFTNAVFESVSGFTTTGISLISDVEILPRSLLLWRGMTHWLGGIGIIVLTVALVPVIGTGGFRLLKMETTGPEKEKFTPKVTETAKILSLIYLGLTGLQSVLLLSGGMNWLDAVFHAFSTMATGGFSTRNDGIAYYRSPYIEWVCTVFMLLAGFNFTLMYRLLRGKLREITHNSEARTYGLVLFVSVFLVTVSILPSSASAGAAVRQAFFQVASIITTTGFSSAGYNLWPPLAQSVLFILMFSGACSGSTSGGIKLIRYVILAKQMKNEMKRFLFSRGVFSIRIDRKTGRKDVVYSVAGFIFLYFSFVLGATLLVCSSGIDLFNSLNTALITVGNIGLGLGSLSSGAILVDTPASVKWGLSFFMLSGRLELLTILVLFMPGCWRGKL
ncbi:MAG: TrkH family potassium uptake protein [Treponema sp.]|nr:TrkH family potassium uptake protein [Treponema sp.]